MEERPRLAEYVAYQVFRPLQIDGQADEEEWATAIWYPIDQFWIGKPVPPEDFSGKFKLLWHEEHLYLLVEIVDDTLVDFHEDGLKFYWNDDCLEIFLDENHSGGKHYDNHNAFAYHVATNGNVVDIGKDGNPLYLNEHILSSRSTNGKKTIWELRISVFDKSFDERLKFNSPVKLYEGKKIGFALAYCDNDYSKERENFIGSVPILGKEKNVAYLYADVFGTLYLKRRKT